MTINEFYIKYSIAENTAEVNEQLKRLNKPKTLAGEVVPESLNHISIGELIMLQTSIRKNKSDYEIFKAFAKVLLKVDITGEERAEDFLGFGLWVLQELERIGKLFDKVKVKPTEEEVQAGYNKLQFGFFGTLDWWCQRMRISDHSEAEKVPWTRMLKCMDMDARKMQYERQLRQIYAQKQTRSRKR